MSRIVPDLKRPSTQKLVNALIHMHLSAGIVSSAEAETVYQYYMTHPELLMAIVKDPMRMELLGFENVEERKRFCLNVLHEYMVIRAIDETIPHEGKYQFAKVHSLRMAA